MLEHAMRGVPTNHRVGYIAAFDDIAECVRGINAFAHGCRAVNAYCEVRAMRAVRRRSVGELANDKDAEDAKEVCAKQGVQEAEPSPRTAAPTARKSVC